jgi:diguanylate cyclase (GGDEF)-like protein
MIRNVMAATRPIAISVCVLAVVSACGYAFSVERLYRPIPDGPASHPLTLLLAFLLASSFIGKRHARHKRRGIVLAFSAMALCSLRLVPGPSAARLFDLLTPFHAVVAREFESGASNSMGANTAVMFLLIALSIFLFWCRWIRTSQIVAFLSLAMPMVAITGYAYSLPAFYGQMSMMTIVFGLPLGLAAASLSANRAMFKAILSPHISGRIARVQIVLGYIFPFLSGFLVLKAIHENGATDLFGAFVVSVSWFIIALVTASSIVSERIDHTRRQYERRLERQATEDPLTGLFNRRHFELCFEAELLRSLRGHHPLSLIVIDIDHFKRVNDTGGHPKGDFVLKTVAAAMKSHTRTTDTLGRLGGEEFAVLLPDTPLEGAAYVAESLRQIIESPRFAPWPGHDGKITASVGCATLAAGERGPDLMHRADAALYAAKQGGRNRVVCADSGSALEPDDRQP